MSDVFVEELQEADSVTVATGYTSAEALAFIGSVVEQNELLRGSESKVSVILGMANLQGLHPTIASAAGLLDKKLRAHGVGSVRPVTEWPFHGKVYLFSRGGSPRSAIIGSSNASALGPSHRLGEIDLLTRDTSMLSSVVGFLEGTLSSALGFLEDLEPGSLVSSTGKRLHHPGRFDFYADIEGEPLDILKGVNRVAPSELDVVKSSLLTKKTFVHRLKSGNDVQKSNLNAALGKGRLRRRLDGSTFIVPRPWYEIELILPKEERESPLAPPARFRVITDDGWTFEVKRQGDYLKNLRTVEDLRPLGLWIKGRLEASGCLTVGDLITEQTLDCYGTHRLRFTPIGDGSGRWFLDFSPET